MVMRLPERDKLSVTREKMHADLAVAMGGRAAEELIFGHDKVTSGASSDINYATRMARAMVTEWGMSDKIGPLHLGSDQQEVFLGSSLVQGGRSISDETASLIDAEVKRIVEEAQNVARKVLSDNANQLHMLAEALLEYETLSGDEIKGLLDGVKPERAGTDATKKPSLVKSSLPSSRKKANGGGGDTAQI
jgi:cell division protease FtsH